MPVLLGLADEEELSARKGTIDFVDNAEDQMTGTLQFRGRFPNPKRLLAPGMLARIRVPVGTRTGRFLFPKGAGVRPGPTVPFRGRPDNKVEYRPVTVGALRDGLRVINEGVSEGERVVLGGLQVDQAEEGRAQ